MTDSERITRLERAVAELTARSRQMTSGLGWRPPALSEIERELAARDAEGTEHRG